MKDTQPALPRIGPGPYTPEREVDITTAKLLQELREEQQSRARLEAELEAAKARQATTEAALRLLTLEKDTTERRLHKLRALFRKPSPRAERTSSPELEQLLRRADDLEAALYDLHSLHAVAQAGGADAGRTANLHLLARIRAIVRQAVPREATVIVVSKGDPELMKLHGRTAWHFPRNAENVYAGVYPRSSTAAIAHLEWLRAQGGDYLVFPATAFWWLEHYAGFREHLARRYRLVADSKDTCRIYALRIPAVNEGAAVAAAFQALLTEFRARHSRTPSILDWNSGLDLAAAFPGQTIFSPPSGDAVLPYLAGSIDITVLSSAAPAALSEARRVAQMAIVRVAPVGRGSGGSPLTTEWKHTGATLRPLSTSIVIPCHNNASETKACLTSLFETLPDTFAGEVIVVDDASTDETPALLKRFAAADKRLRVVRNAKNAGFILSCNRGAKSATGDLLLFLNNDTVLLPGWLWPILTVFRDDKKTGVVGGKLLFPDGRLQEAGGLVFRDGSAAHFGRGDYDTDGFLYQFLREVDYCSGAFFATPRALFDDLDGFDRHYQPAYYEDVDYCFKARSKGYRVYYQPESTIVHVEGASSGVDPTQGVKRHIVANQRKFSERWKNVLRHHPVRPSHDDTAAWQAVAVTKRLAR